MQRQMELIPVDSVEEPAPPPGWDASVTLYQGDSLDVLATLPENSIETCITDPPYGIGFMERGWDKGVPSAEMWAAILRVIKPGGLLLAFGGTRTFHRMMVQMEDAGWIIRDTLMWLYGSGFPKNHNISAAIDGRLGADRQVVETIPNRWAGKGQVYNHHKGEAGGMAEIGAPATPEAEIGAPATPEAELWDGWGTALKPAWEPIIVCMKPLAGTYAENALAHGVAGYNIGGALLDGDDLKPFARADRDKKNGWRMGASRYEPQGGRWPSNVLLDEENAAALDAQTGDTGGAARYFYVAKPSQSERHAGLRDLDARPVNDGRRTPIDNPYQRGVTERHNTHPTVKPIALMRHLVRLTATPTGGTVIDPFMGSGTTGIAAVLENRHFVGCDLKEEYVKISHKRIEHWRKKAGRH